jgi:hypothetical protein
MKVKGKATKWWFLAGGVALGALVAPKLRPWLAKTPVVGTAYSR